MRRAFVGARRNVKPLRLIAANKGGTEVDNDRTGASALQCSAL